MTSNMSLKPHLDERHLDMAPGLLVENAKNVKEAAYVQNSYSSVFGNELRTLIEATFKAGELSAPNVRGAISLALRDCLPLHQNTVFSAVCIQNLLFSGSNPGASSEPLWIKLLHTKTGALRQISQDWIKSADHFLSCLGLPLTTELAQESVGTPELAYRLGKWDLSKKLLEASDGLLTKPDLLLRIRIAQLDVDNISLDEIESLSLQDGTRQSIEASYTLANVRLGKTFDVSRTKYLKLWSKETLETKNNTVTDDLLLRAIHVLNSLNLIYFRQDEMREVLESLNLVEDLAGRISDLEKQGHALGNLFYHKSIIARRECNEDLELEYLFKANELDPGFTDYAYRIAQIFHDRADQKAGDYYLRALETSPFFHSLVNDYGCFLSEFGTQEELGSWERLAAFIFPCSGPSVEASQS